MNEPSLNDSKNCVLTLLKCVLLNTLHNVVRSLLSAGVPSLMMASHNSGLNDEVHTPTQKESVKFT